MVRCTSQARRAGPFIELNPIWACATLYGRASRIMLNRVPPRLLSSETNYDCQVKSELTQVMTSRSRASPACAPSAAPTSCEREVGTHPIVESVIDPANWVQIVFEFVTGHGFDNHPRAIRL